MKYAQAVKILQQVMIETPFYEVLPAIKGIPSNFIRTPLQEPSFSFGDGNKIAGRIFMNKNHRPVMWYWSYGGEDYKLTAHPEEVLKDWSNLDFIASLWWMVRGPWEITHWLQEQR